jgi:type IV pilus assembly protein PilC
MVGFYLVEQSLKQIEQDIMHGVSLYDSIRKFPIYDQRMVVLLKVGEESSKLDMFFEKLAAYYNEDIEHRTALLSSFLEPLIIVFLGGIIAIILLAMYLPMFEISTVI